MDTYIRARIDSELKAQAESVCKQMGISASDFIRLSLVRLVEERKIPNQETLTAFAEFDGDKPTLKRGKSSDIMALIERL